MITKNRLREIRDMLDLAVGIADKVTAGDAAAEVVSMMLFLHAQLAFEAVPELLEEVERLQKASRESTAPSIVKFDPRGGSA